MPSIRPCMACNAPLDRDGDCSTPQCPYNPNEDTKVHEAEFEYVEGKGFDPSDMDSLDLGPDMSDDELRDLLDDDIDYDGDGDESEPIHSDDLTPEEREQREPPKDDKLDNKIDQDADDADDRMGGSEGEDDAEDESGGDEGDMDTEDVDEGEGEPESHDENDPEDEKGSLDELPENLPEPDEDLSQDEIDELANEGKQNDTEKQLTEEDLGEDPSDDALNLEDQGEDDLSKEREDGDDEGLDDDGLPPRPQNCNGDCKPSDDPGSEDGEPCPHCTAKGFRDEMEQEGKDNLPEEEMEQEWQNFLDNWHQEAEEHDAPKQGDGEGSGGDQDDADTEDVGEDDSDEEEARDDEGEIKSEDEIQPEQEDSKGGGEDDHHDPDEDDLPPRPQGCDGDCQPGDQYDDDAEPCPHCTAKNFKQELQREEELGGEFDEEQIGQMFEDYLKQWNEENDDGMKNDEELDKQEEEFQQKNEQKDEEPPEDELQDDEPDEDDEDREQNAEVCAFCKQEITPIEANHDNEPDYKAADDTTDCSAREGGGFHEPADWQEKDEQPKEFKRMAKDMTITQEKRFDNLVDRIAKKVEGTFGQTAEDVYTMPKTEGQFKGEEVSQAIQITSRGVTYWVTVSAAKDPSA